MGWLLQHELLVNRSLVTKPKSVTKFVTFLGSRQIKKMLHMQIRSVMPTLACLDETKRQVKI